MSAIHKRLLSPQEYLAKERLAPFRSEFYRGEMFAMAGGTPRHSRIKVNVGAELNNRLKDGPCVTYDCDLRILIAATGLYTYPDFSVICGDLQFDVQDTKHETATNPTTIVEVLSDSTEAYDRGGKFEQYKLIPTMREYLLVSQNSPQIERWSRQADDTWLPFIVTGLDQSIDLPALGITLPLAAVYSLVDFNSPLEVPT
jgi:Uma2 family endonuclease